MTKEQLKKMGIAVDETKDYTAEEMDSLIEAHFSSISSELSRSKELVSQRNSEIKKMKDKEQEKLTDDEKLKLHYQEIEETNKKLTRQISRSDKVANYVAIGYSKELAEKIADAELDGKSTVEFHRSHIEAVKEAEKQALLNKNPAPHTNDNLDTVTKEDFDKMPYSKRLELMEKNPQKYEEFSKKN